MLSRIVVLLMAQVIFLLSVCSASSNINLEQRLWLSNISASGRCVSSAFTGNLDLQKDLGFRGTTIPQLRMIWDINPSQSIRLDYFGGQFTGTADKTERREFFGGLISREFKHHVEESLGIKFWKVGWIYYGKSRPQDKIRVGYMLDIKTVLLDGRVTLHSVMAGGSPVTIREQSTWRMTAPTIGFVIKGQPNERLHYSIECAGLTTGKNGFMFADYEGSIKWFVDAKRSTSIVVGYHVINYDNYQKNEKSQLDRVRIAGAFYGIEKKF